MSIQGICVNVRDFSGRTPLHLTFINRNSNRIITSLIKHGADFTIRDNSGGTPFLNAMLFFEDDWLVHMIFDHLVDYDIHQQDDKGFDLLRWAVECRCPLLVRKIMTGEETRIILIKMGVIQWRHQSCHITKRYKKNI